MFNLVYSGDFQKQLKRLKSRYSGFDSVLAGVEFSLRTNPFIHGLDEDGFGVAFTKQFWDVPPLHIAFQVSTKTATLLAIEPRP